MKMTKTRMFAAGALLAAGLLARPASAARTHSAAVVDTRADVLAEFLPESCTCGTDDESVLSVTFTEDLDGAQFDLPEEMGPLVFDLNGHEVTGKDGENGGNSGGEDGSWVVRVGEGTDVSVTDGTGDGGRFVGGNGGNGNPPGAGAFPFVGPDGNPLPVTVVTGLVLRGADGAETLPVGEDAYMVATDDGWEILGEGPLTNLPPGFDLNSITNMTVGDGITSIPARFFKKCRKMNSIALGKNVVSVGTNAFYLCVSLETIDVGNPAALDSLTKGAIVYQTAIKPDGSLYPIPNVTATGYAQFLEGKAGLADTEWTDLGKVDPERTMESYEGYHFFRVVLRKIGE